MRYKLPFLLITFFLLFLSISAFAQHLPFQGKLLENGLPVNGTKTFVFSINQGSINWSETHPNVPVNNGLYAVILGSITPLPANLFAAQTALNLNISVNGVPLDVVPIYPPIEADPTVPATVKDGITWNEIGNIPPKIYVDTSATNELQHLSIQGNFLSISNGNTVEIPVLSDSTTIDGDLVVGGTFQVGVQDTISNSICQLQSGNEYALENTIWQSFTPTKTGVLSSIEVEFGDVFNTNIKLTIFPGQGTSGQAIWSKTYSTNLFPAEVGMRTFTIDANAVSLTFGQVLTFQVVGISNGVFVSKVSGNPYPEGISNYGANFDLKFCLHYSSISETALFVDENGNVGIGTQTPRAKLEVKASEELQGNVLLIADPSGETILKIGNDGVLDASGLIMNLLTSHNACIDIDGNAYPTFTIGTQVWMAENLRVTKYRDGSSIPNVTSNSSWAALTTGAYCWYNNDQTTNGKYGTLYNWYAVNDSHGLCPEGWHVPSDTEWTTFTTCLGGTSISGGKMKSVSSLWTSPNTDATNSSGFSGLPGGYRITGGSFNDLGGYGFFWSSLEGSATDAWSRYLNYNTANVNRFSGTKVDGFSVRCLRD